MLEVFRGWNLIAVLLVLAPLASAQELSLFLACSKVEDSLERLRCYDAAAKAVPKAAESDFVSVDGLDPGGVGRAVDCPLRMELSFSRQDVERKGVWTTGRTGALRCNDTSIPSVRIEVSQERALSPRPVPPSARSPSPAPA